jgi:hypothetical protein
VETPQLGHQPCHSITLRQGDQSDSSLCTALTMAMCLIRSIFRCSRFPSHANLSATTVSHILAAFLLLAVHLIPSIPGYDQFLLYFFVLIFHFPFCSQFPHQSLLPLPSWDPHFASRIRRPVFCIYLKLDPSSIPEAATSTTSESIHKKLPLSHRSCLHNILQTPMW